MKDLTPAEKNTVATIRKNVPRPTADTVMQKVVPISDLANYLNGTRTQVKGCVTAAADSKHLKTFDEIYHGERLDYTMTDPVTGLTEPSPFTGASECAVIRYKSDDTGNVVSLDNRPDSKDPGAKPPFCSDAPFTNHGFTSGSNGTLGVPEWGTAPTKNITEGEVWVVDSSGKESLVGVYNPTNKRFQPVY